MIMMMKMMVVNSLCGMLEQRKAFSLISTRDHFQTCSQFEPSQNLKTQKNEAVK